MLSLIVHYGALFKKSGVWTFIYFLFSTYLAQIKASNVNPEITFWDRFAESGSATIEN